MTHPNRHRIQRQILELDVGSVGEAPAVQQRLARPFWDRVVPELEGVFDRVAGPDELLRLDRLELDLGTITGGDWPAEFRKKLIAELTRSLARFAPDSERGDDDGHGGLRRAEPWRQFLFFLAHGRLPWWAAARVSCWDDLLSAGSDSDWKALRETVSSDPRARVRLAYSVDDAFLERAIVHWSGVAGAARVLALLAPSQRDAGPQRAWRRGFWMLVLDCVATGGLRAPGSGEQLVRDLRRLRVLYESDSGASPTLGQQASDASEHGARPANVDLPEPWRTWWLAQDEMAQLERTATETLAAIGGVKDRPLELPPTRARTSRKTRPATDDEAIYLSGAGVVLVHPFLEQLFRERELLDGKRFRDLEAHNRAVQMIGLITFGRADVPEHELLLAKVLCGAAIDEPFEPVLLDDEDVAACDALVPAVLQHWTALRSSSPEWLREQFFLRDGKLEEADAGHRLTIERRAQDVLLARLPWGFGVVALPWLTTHVFVHWLD